MWSPRTCCRRSRLAIAGVLLLSTFVLVPAAGADDTSLGAVGGNIVARPASGIRMDAETVQATCFGSFAEYRVDFRFVNDGPSRTVRLGFPFSSTLTGTKGGERPFGFQAWQGTRPLAVKVVPSGSGTIMGSPSSGYFVHTARFPHGPTTVTVSYLAQVSSRAGLRDPERAHGGGSAHWYEYWLHTGRTWEGPIGAAVVRFALADTFRGMGVGLTAAEADPYAPVTTPGWTRPLPGVYQWRRASFEPEPARGRDWWDAQSASDITLGFGIDWSRQAPSQRWTASPGAKATAPSAATWVYAGGRPGAVADGQLGTCWIARRPSDDTDIWLQSTFKRPRRIRELRIVTGDNAYIAAFSRYGRPKTITATFSDGRSVVLHLTDAPVLQRFPVDVTTDSVRLTVDDVYEGTDYPAVCVSEVEFGRVRAPGYASFRELLAHDEATGRSAAWAGRVTGGIRAAGRVDEWQAREDAEAVAGGDLIGVDEIDAVPTDAAPFRTRATLAELEGHASILDLPPEEMVGRPLSVDALSTHTFDIRYASGVELLVNTRADRDDPRGVLSELVDEARYMADYTDGRKLPYEVTTVGDRVVGVARRGTISCCCGEGDVHVPAQVFWRDGTATYHLYARDRQVTAADLTAVATRMLVGPPAASPSAPAEGHHPWWWAALLSAALVAVAVFLLRHAARPLPARD